MDISEANLKIVDGLMNRAALCRPDASFMALRETKDSADWWKLGERIEVHSLLFRIVRVFSRFKMFFPRQLRWWYLNQVRDVYYRYCEFFVEKLSDEKKLDYKRKGMSPDLYAQVKLAFKDGPVVDRAKPNEFDPDKTIAELAKRFHYRNMFSEINRNYARLLDAHTTSTLSKHMTTMKHFPGQLPEDYCDALAHIEAVVLSIEGNEADVEISLVLKLLLKMTTLGIRQENLKDYIVLHQLYHASKETGYRVLDLDDRKFFVVEGEDGRPLARVGYLTTPDGSVARKRLAYEIDALLGYEGIPPTAHWPGGNTLQKYIPSAETLDSYLSTHADAAEKIEGMDLAAVHAHQIFGLIQGRPNGCGNKTLVQSMRGAPPKVYDIDEEENFIATNMDLGDDSANEGDQGRIFATMGFPQGAQPLSKLMLKLFSWEGLKHRVLKQFDRRAPSKKNIKRLKFLCRRDALADRLERIVEVCRFELKNEIPTLTPRKLYFLIYGKDWLFHAFRVNGYSDYEFFNGGMCRNDDDIPKRERTKYHSSVQHSGADTLRKLGQTPPDDPELWAHYYEQGKDMNEKYPGDDFISCLKHWLSQSRTIEFCEVLNSAFDEDGWVGYKKSCSEAGQPVRSFMLSYFLKGYVKRLARQFTARVPFCTLDIVKKGTGQYLELTKPLNVVRVDDEIAAFGRSNKRRKIAIVKKIDFCRDIWLMNSGVMAQDGGIRSDESRWIVKCVYGPQSRLINRVYSEYIMSSQMNRYFQVCETEKGYEIYLIQTAPINDENSRL